MVVAAAFPMGFDVATRRVAMSTKPRDRALRLDVREFGWSSHRARGNPAGSDRGAAGYSVPKLPIGVREGEVLAEKYRIGETIGAGAMGVVVAARHLLLDQKVAIKFLVPRAQEHPSSIARFMREARATARIKSHHVVRVLDVAVLDSGVPYIVMEFLEGCDLAEWLRRRGSLPADEACDVILQACDAVHEAHGLDIIHRDLKPPNLFVVHQASVVQTIKVLDFGISKMTEVTPGTIGPNEWKAGSVVTEDRTTIGSPHYMSPEQMESARDVDARTDVWALGVTLYELITGRLPFEGASFLQVYSRIAAETPGHLSASLAGVAPGLSEVIMRCLERNRERRFGSVSDLAMALVPYGSGRAPAYVERIARSGPRAVGAPSDATPSPRVLPLPEVDKTLPSPVARTPAGPIPTPAAATRTPAAANGEERRARRPVLLGASGIAVLVLVLWASAPRRAPSAASDGPASVKTEAKPSPLAPAGFDAVLESPRPTVADASGPATSTSVPASPVAAATHINARVPPPVPPPLGSVKAPPARPSPSARPDAAPSTQAGSAASDGEWVPPDVQR